MHSGKHHHQQLNITLQKVREAPPSPLGVFDAAPMARKFKADSNHCIDFKKVNIKTSKIWYVGAGFGYKINQH